jgi:hypothetical protein
MFLWTMASLISKTILVINWKRSCLSWLRRYQLHVQGDPRWAWPPCTRMELRSPLGIASLLRGTAQITSSFYMELLHIFCHLRWWLWAAFNLVFLRKTWICLYRYVDQCFSKWLKGTGGERATRGILDKLVRKLTDPQHPTIFSKHTSSSYFMSHTVRCLNRAMSFYCHSTHNASIFVRHSWS